MANKTIGDLSAASTLTGSEKIPIEQSGVSVITTPADLKTYAATGNLQLRAAWAACTMSGSTVTLRNSSGITSVVRDSAGNFTVTMSTARNNIYYQVVGSASPNYGAVYFGNLQINSAAGVEAAPTTTVFKFEILPLSGSAYDAKYFYFSVYENA